MKFRPGQLIQPTNNEYTIYGYEPKAFAQYTVNYNMSATATYEGQVSTLERRPMLYLHVEHEPRSYSNYESPRWIAVIYDDQILVVNEERFEAV